MTEAQKRKSIVVAVCTYKRNDYLEALLRALVICAERIRDRAAIGVVIVDDTAAGEAQSIAGNAASWFELGLQYRISGKQNISLARNLAIETAIDMADWVAMTDDDCEPPAQWLEALLDAQLRSGVAAVTGRLIRRVPAGSPVWLTEEPFLELGQHEPPDGATMEVAATYNSLISADWLRRHTQIRFDPDFGVIGGEDMVFYRAARAAGLEIRFVADASVYENEPPARATLGYQLYAYFWHGNSACLTMLEHGTNRWRMLVHAGASLMRATARPLQRLGQGKKPQLRFCLAQTLHALGKFAGLCDIRVSHR